MFFKLAKHRKFEYTPRYYNPDKDRAQQTRVHFRHLRHRRKNYSIIWMLALLIFVLYLILGK